MPGRERSLSPPDQMTAHIEQAGPRSARSNIDGGYKRPHCANLVRARSANGSPSICRFRPCGASGHGTGMMHEEADSFGSRGGAKLVFASLIRLIGRAQRVSAFAAVLKPEQIQRV